MNTNTGNDPMLSSFISDDWVKFPGTLLTAANPTFSLVISQPSSSTFLSPADEIMSPDHNFSDLASMWANERRRVSSVKMEDDDSFSSYTVTEDVDEGDTDMGEIDIGDSTVVANIKSEVDDHEYGDVATVNTGDIPEFKFEINKYRMTETEARRFVEEQFEKIAFVPKSNLNQREKIESIVAMSDCKDFSVDDILNFDKKCPDSARACAKIVQNIPQRYRWECVQPEDIPCCYTIVADCKKVSSRDKPPRPMNAFMIWAQGARRLINELCPKMQNAIISEALGYYWREKSDTFKQRFEREKMKLRNFHNVEFPEYKYKPKTKVQKAKEKQQLSLNKAKIRASAKLDKLLDSQQSKTSRTNSSGRSKKTKSVSSQREVNGSKILFSEKVARKSPTIPAIKDMLTLKILNDRKCRGVPSVSPKPQEVFLSAFGQMSPLEVTEVGLDDTKVDIDEVVDNGFDTAAPLDMDIICRTTPPSVFDTPANTPPVDDVNDDHHSSPPLTQQSLSTSAEEQTLHMRSDIPSSSATTSIPTVRILPLKNDNGLSLLELLSRGATLPSLRQRSVSTFDQAVDITDWLFNFVSQSVSTMDQSTSSKYSIIGDSKNSDLNNNRCYSDVNNNNNCYNDVNNNSLDVPTSSADIRSNSKLSDSSTDTCDLETLSLDLSAPLLSDDDLRSILNSL